MKTKNLITFFGIALVLLAIAPLAQAATLGANLFYEDTDSTTKTIDEGESFYLEAYGDSFEEKITSAKLVLVNENTNKELTIFSESTDTTFYSKTHYLIDGSKYPDSGDYTLEFVVKGEFGTQASDELSLTVEGDEPQDNEDPSVEITNPSEGETLDSTEVTVEFTATDNEGVDTCEYTLNGGDRQNVDCSEGTFNMTAQEGQNTLTIYATDDKGNEGSESVTFTVDTSPSVDTEAPTITIDSPIDGEVYETNNINVNVTTDEEAKLEYELSGAENIDRRDLTTDYVTSYNTTLQQLQKGEYELTIYATDNSEAENTANKTVNFEISSSLSSEDEEDSDEEGSYEHRIYKEQYEPKTTKIGLTEDEEKDLNWFQKFINWLWELFGAEAPY